MKPWVSPFILMLIVGAPLAAESLIGKQVRFDVTFPDTNSVVASATLAAVDPGVEVNCATPTSTGPACGLNINQGGYTLDLQANHIIFRTSSTISSRFGVAPCNCYRFTLVNPGQLYFSSASLSGNLAGPLTFTDTSILVNLSGVTAPAQGSFDISFQLDSRGPFEVTPSSLSFSSIADGPVPFKFLAVGESATDRNFTVSTSHQSPQGGSWLRVASSGRAPAQLRVGADPAGLSPGQYSATVTISSPPTTVSIPVSFEVEPALPAKLVLGPFEFIQIPLGNDDATPNAGGGYGILSNAGSGTLGPLRVSVRPPAGATVTAELRPPGCSVGPATPECTVSLTGTSSSSRSTSGTLVVQRATDGRTLGEFRFVIVPRRDTLSVLPRAFFIGALADPTSGGLPTRLPLLTVLTLRSWSGRPVSYSGETLVPWLTFNSSTDPIGPNSILPRVTIGDFVGQGTSVVNASAGGLAPGGYYGAVQFRPGGGGSEVQSILEVVPSSGAPRNNFPIRLTYGFESPVLIKGRNPSQRIYIRILDAVDRPVTVTDNYMNGLAFFTHSQSAPTGSALQDPGVVVTLNPSMPPGVYSGALTVQAGTRTETIPVVAVVPTTLAAPNPAVRAAEACVPTKIVPLVAAPLMNFSVRAAWPTELNVAVVDDCGVSDKTHVVTASFSNGDPSVILDSLGNGTWSGVWVGQRVDNNMGVTIRVASRDGKLTTSASVGGAVTANPGVPLVAQGGVVNGASFAGGILSPGSFVSIFGVNLAEGELKAPTVPLPLTLAGASVQIGGVDAPVFYASGGQLNAIIPYGLPVDQELAVVVKRGSAVSVNQPVILVSAAPGIFQYRDQLGIVVGVNSDGSQPLADAANPVAAGQTIVAYATGLGEVSPAVSAGSPTPAILARTTNPVAMTIGGKEARVEFAGLTPGQTGLYQVNAVVPEGIAPGSRVPVILTAAEQSSVAVYIAVK